MMPDQDKIEKGRIEKEGKQEESTTNEALSSFLESPEKEAEKLNVEKKAEAAPGNPEAIEFQEKEVGAERKETGSELIEEKIDQQQTAVSQSDDHDEDEEKKELKQHADDIAGVQDAEEQINKLVSLATQKDPYAALKVAKDLDDNYVLDVLHDELIEDKTRAVLLEKGLLKE